MPESISGSIWTARMASAVADTLKIKDPNSARPAQVRNIVFIRFFNDNSYRLQLVKAYQVCLILACRPCRQNQRVLTVFRSGKQSWNN